MTTTTKTAEIVRLHKEGYSVDEIRIHGDTGESNETIRAIIAKNKSEMAMVARDAYYRATYCNQ